jgi:hypothetical protein
MTKAQAVKSLSGYAEESERTGILSSAAKNSRAIASFSPYNSEVPQSKRLVTTREQPKSAGWARGPGAGASDGVGRLEINFAIDRQV